MSIGMITLATLLGIFIISNLLYYLWKEKRMRPLRKKLHESHERFKQDKSEKNMHTLLDSLTAYNRERFGSF